MTQHSFSRLPKLAPFEEGALFTAWTRSIVGDWNDQRVHAMGTNLARLTESAISEYERARAAMDRGCDDPQQMLGALIETATRLEVCVCSLHRAYRLVDKLCRLTSYPEPTFAVGKQFWHDLEELRHGIEHMDEHLSGLDLRWQLPTTSNQNATLIVKKAA